MDHQFAIALDVMLRRATRRLFADWLTMVRSGAAPTAVIVSLLCILALLPNSLDDQSVPYALWVLPSITFLTVLVLRDLRFRAHLDTRDAPDSRLGAFGLPLPVYTLYLATAVLAGTRGALALAIATPLLSSLL